MKVQFKAKRDTAAYVRGTGDTIIKAGTVITVHPKPTAEGDVELHDKHGGLLMRVTAEDFE